MRNFYEQRVSRAGQKSLCRLVCLLLLCLAASGAHAQRVTGHVVDATGEAVIGASVVVKGTSNGGVTDFDGNFALNDVPQNASIVVSYIGYLSQTIAVGGRSVINVTLQEDRQMLDEVVVVGYGTQKKSDVTGSMVNIGEDQLNNRPVNNAFEALQGKAAGVDITTNERPGQIGSIRIRGERSLNGGNTPL